MNAVAEFLVHDRVVIVDAEDYPIVSRHSWHLVDMNGLPYVTRNVSKNPRATESLHRLVMGPAPDRWSVIDHRDGNTLDNRKANLRFVKKDLNAFNSRRLRSGATIGVKQVKRTGKWVAQIRVAKKTVHIGTFVTKEDAIAARRLSEAHHYGEQA